MGVVVVQPSTPSLRQDSSEFQASLKRTKSKLLLFSDFRVCHVGKPVLPYFRSEKLLEIGTSSSKAAILCPAHATEWLAGWFSGDFPMVGWGGGQGRRCEDNREIEMKCLRRMSALGVDWPPLPCASCQPAQPSVLHIPQRALSWGARVGQAPFSLSSRP
jgi:hypothetical protein